MIVGVSGGSVEVRIGDRPPVVIKELEGRLVAPPGEMQLQISSRANVFDSLRVEESIDGDTLATKGSIKINRLRLRESLAALFPRPDEYIEDGEISVDVVLTSVGPQEDQGGSRGNFAVTRPGAARPKDGYRGRHL